MTNSLSTRLARSLWAAAGACLYFTISVVCLALLNAGMVSATWEPALSLFIAPAVLLQGSAGSFLQPFGLSQGEAIVLPKPAAALATCAIAVAATAALAFFAPIRPNADSSS